MFMSKGISTLSNGQRCGERVWFIRIIPEHEKKKYPFPNGQTDGRTDGWTDGQTDGRTENLPILQDFVPYRGRCPAAAQL